MRSLAIIGYLCLAIPFFLTMLWVMSILALGLGIPLPYLFLAETGLGFWRVIIFGSMFHLFMAVLLFLAMKATDGLNINIDALLSVALAELVFAMLYIIGSDAGFTW